MAQKSEIEWTDATWNPVTGCTKIGLGCDNCYAERFAERWRGIEGHPYEYGFDLRLRPARLKQPAQWRKPRMIFVNSMSDLFHKSVPREFINLVFDTMEEAHWHVYQVLTKRSSLMRNYVKKRYEGGRVPSHIWLGVSVEDAAHAGRINHLRQINSEARFVSFEPLLGPVGEVDLSGIAWAIVGGESGPRSRPMDGTWATDIRHTCEHDGVAFFFKQWGGARPKSGGRLLDGEEWNGFPWQIVPEKIMVQLKGQIMNEQPNYRGREQSYIKHQFLTKYLEAAAFKIYQSKSKTINFIDAFAGPWKVKDERDYSDASFSQAVRTLEDVRKYLEKNDVKNLKLNSYFCEIDADKIKQLNEYKNSHPNLNIKIFSGKFEDNLGQILYCCKKGFTFTFIDPTGWDIDSKPIFEFLRKFEGEFIMNFMADPINRHVTNPKVEQSFCRFLADPNWSERFEGYPHKPIKEREILKLLKQRIKSTDVADFVPDFPIENPNQKRIKMRLLLGTNKLAGIEVFRDIQQKVEKEAIKLKEQIREDKTKQPTLFTREEIVALESNQSGVGCDKYKTQARNIIVKILGEVGDGCEYSKIIHEVLENTPIRRTDLNKLVRSMERSNSIELLYPNDKRSLSYETIIKHNDKLLEFDL